MAPDDGPPSTDADARGHTTAVPAAVAGDGRGLHRPGISWRVVERHAMGLQGLTNRS
jgi:hypothetical protein